MKIEQQPENEAWRRRREEELRAQQPDPWYVRQTREDRIGDGVAPMRAPTAPQPPSPVPDPSPPAAPAAETVRARPDATRPPASTLTAERPAPTLTGTVGRPSAIVAGLLLAVAAGWQARDMFAPAPPPRLAPVVAVPRAPAPPPVVAQQCDAPGVIDGLRASIAADVRREGADAAWSTRVAGETEVTVAPQVTTIGSDGTRFCGVTMTLTPPATTRPMAPIVAPVTYSTGAGDDRRGPVFGLQGAVSSVAALVALGQPETPAVPPVVPTPPATTPVKPLAAKPVVVPTRQQPFVKPLRAEAVKLPKRETARPPSTEPPEHSRATEPAPVTVPAPASPTIAAASPPAARNACADAVSRAEGMICASPSLGRLDHKLNTVLDRVQSSGDARLIDKVDSGQRRFLARRDRCTDGECVAGRIADRLDDIARIEAKQAAREDDQARKAVPANSRALPQCKGFEVYRPTRPCRVGR